MPKQEFDTKSFLNEAYGLDIVGTVPGSDGMVRVRPIDDRGMKIIEETAGPYAAMGVKSKADTTMDFDVKGLMGEYLVAQGVEPASVNLMHSSPDNPLSEGSVGFLDQVKLATTSKPSDKGRILKEIYGADNVKWNKDLKTFAVKDSEDGQWRRGESGFLSELVAESPTIGASIKGGIIGSAGGLPGAVVGAGIGAVVGKFATIKAAEEAGLRTEQDAEETAWELSKEFALGAGGPLVGPALKGAAKAVGKGGAALASGKTGLLVKDKTARLMSLMNQKDTWINHSWLENPKFVEQVRDNTKLFIADPKNAGRIAPARKKAVRMLEAGVERVKKNMFDEYGNVIKEIGPELKTKRIEVGGLLTEVEKQYKALGLMDDAGKFLSPGDRFTPIGARSSVNRLKEVHRMIETAKARGGKGGVSFEDTETLARAMGDIIEAGRGWAGGPGSISSEGIRALKGIRAGLRQEISGQLPPELGSKYAALTKKYAQRREWLDDLAATSRENRVESTFNKFFSDTGGNPGSEKMALALADAGTDTMKFFNRAKQLKAGLDLAKTDKRLMYGTAGEFSARTTKNLFRAGRAVTPERLSDGTFKMLKTRAAFTEQLDKMPLAQKLKLWESPESVQALTEILLQADESAAVLPQVLVSEAAGQQR